MESTIIYKEHLHNQKFSWDDVHHHLSQKLQRRSKLLTAMKLGNVHKTHVELMFKNHTGELMSVVATVWAVTEKYIVLKGNVTIPISSVWDVKRL